MEIIIELVFKKDNKIKKHIVNNTTTAKTITELMITKGWKLIITELMLNI